jgi:twinkle protein
MGNMNNSDKLYRLGIDLRGHQYGQVKTMCPKCSNGRKKKDPCLSVDIDTGLFKCHHCDWKGSVNQYVRPESRAEVKTSGVITYFEKRGITEKTMRDFKITEGVEWMPQDQKEHKVICFNYFLEDDLVNIKFKTSDKKFKMVKDAQKIPYNLNSILKSDKVIICEGEEECMVWHQCGFPFAVSVPNGASKTNNNLDWLDSVYEYFQGKIIYLATDNDEPGRKLAEDIARRFEAEDIRMISFPEKEKDSNDVLVHIGEHAVISMFQTAKQKPINEIATAEDYREVIYGYHESGYPVGAQIGMSETDEHITWSRGELVVVTGIPGSGKSTWLDFVYTRLAVRSGWRFGIFSPENVAPLKITRLSEQIMGYPLKKMNKMQIDRAISKINQHFYFYNIEQMEDYSIDGILSIAKNMIRRHGIDCLCLDPFNYISLQSTDDNSNEKIGELLRKLKQFAVKNNVNVTLVAHPRKMDKSNGSYNVPRLYDISGSHHFFNVPDIGLAIHRNYVDGSNDPVELHVQKMKYHFRGSLGKVEYQFEPSTGRYSEDGHFNKLIDYVPTDEQDLFGPL